MVVTTRLDNYSKDVSQDGHPTIADAVVLEDVVKKKARETL